MTANAVIVRYAEVFLKGGRRGYFTKMLEEGLEFQVRAAGPFKVREHHGFLLVVHRGAKGPDLPDLDVGTGLVSAIMRTFGVVSFSPCMVVSREMACLERHVAKIAEEDVSGAESFKIDSSRSDKDFPIDSMELNQRLGAIAAEKSGVRVRLKGPEVTLHCKILRKFAILYLEVMTGSGGLPMGTSGRVSLLLSGGIDSPVAGYMAMRRGCRLDATHFESAPYTKPQARGKVEDLSRRLAAYEGRLKLNVVPFGSIQADLRDSAPGKQLVVLYRRFMVRIASALGAKQGAVALVTGENLGQVASQTLENIAVIEAASDLPVLRPLLTWDKMETVAAARRIGTYETSILPFDDCCSLFVPAHPETAAQADVIEDIESQFDVQGMVSQAVAATETIDIEAT